jgi:nucleoside-diphosphate-sugar epimerase
MKKRLSIVGLGWFGMELAKALSEDYTVFGTKRSVPSRETTIKTLPLSFNPEPSGTSLAEIFDAELLIVNIPPNSRSQNAESDYRKIMDAILEAIALSPVERAVFVSSTGVFGENEGRVDEESIPIPSSTGGRILFEAEQRFLSASFCETCILRPAGLVGGQRHPAKFLAGREGVSGRKNPVNLVHRHDLIAMTSAILAADVLPGRVFHAAAAYHPSKEEYYQTMAAKMNLEIPSFDLDDDSIGKEIDAERSKGELKVKFKYDDPFTMI